MHDRAVGTDIPEERVTHGRTIRVVIADDHQLIRDSLKKLLDPENDIEVIGEAGNGCEALERVRELAPDILLLDLNMPIMNGVAVLRALQHSTTSTKIIVLTASEDMKDFVQAMQLGCSGIVLKQTPLVLIVKSIRTVHAGEIWLDSHITAEVMRIFLSGNTVALTGQCSISRHQRSLLSRREQEIAGLVAQGHKNKEMAEKLSISEHTIKNHLLKIFDKLGISNRVELALYITAREPARNGRTRLDNANAQSV